MVTQDEREALAPIRAIGQFALIMVLLAIVMLTLFAVYFFMHRKQSFEEIGELRHPPRTTSA